MENVLKVDVSKYVTNHHGIIFDYEIGERHTCYALPDDSHEVIDHIILRAEQYGAKRIQLSTSEHKSVFPILHRTAYSEKDLATLVDRAREHVQVPVSLKY